MVSDWFRSALQHQTGVSLAGGPGRVFLVLRLPVHPAKAGMPLDDGKQAPALRQSLWAVVTKRDSKGSPTATELSWCLISKSETYGYIPLIERDCAVAVRNPDELSMECDHV